VPVRSPDLAQFWFYLPSGGAAIHAKGISRDRSLITVWRIEAEDAGNIAA
jgi:hypothetical protein